MHELNIGIVELWGTGNSGLYATLFANGIKKNSNVYLYTSNNFQYENLCRTNLKKIFIHPEGKKADLKLLRMLYIVYSYLAAFFILRQDRLDIIHFQPIGFSFIPIDILFYYLTKFYIPTAFITIHNINDPKSNNFFNQLLLFFLRSTKINVIVHDENNKQFLKNRGVKNINIIEHGVYTLYFRSIKNKKCEHIDVSTFNKKSKLRLLIFGSISRYKGIPPFLNEFIKIKDLDVTVTVIGESKSSRLIEEINDIAKNNSNIFFINKFIPDENLNDLFSYFDVCVLPYTKQFKSQSGALYLSYTFKTPVIVTEAGGLGWSVKRNKSGSIINVTKDEINNCIYRFLANNKSMLRHMQQELKTIDVRLNWNTLGNQMHLYYNYARSKTL